MLVYSVRSKLFRGVGERRKSEERDFRRFARAKNGARAKGGEGKQGKQVPSFPSPTPSFVFWLARQNTANPRKSPSSVSLYTPRKRSLRRLVCLINVVGLKNDSNNVLRSEGEFETSCNT